MNKSKIGIAPAGLAPWEKGVPPTSENILLDDVPKQGWEILREDLPLPLAVIRESALRHNSAWMKRFLSAQNVRFAPHGKTTMAPDLFGLQIADGAWAITLSTTHQIRVARAFGHSRIFLANQLVGRAAIEFALSEIRNDPDFEFYCLVDDAENAKSIARQASMMRLPRAVNVLVELGYPGGRTGCRSVAQAFDLARVVAATAGLSLAGIEGFEGLLNSPQPAEAAAKVEAFLDCMVDLAERCAAEHLFSVDEPILSAGGSSYFDIVAAKLKQARLGRPHHVVLRSGCYITHDAMMYTRAFERLRERSPAIVGNDEGFRPALEVWSYVQSRPEPQKAILGLGKRDISPDEPPVALSWYRPNSGMGRPLPIPPEHKVTGLNDQHCHMTLPASSQLSVGDMVALGISHPCLTFDKWRIVHMVDDDYRITRSLRTYF
ncbi:amino acid deaminase [Bradyrhizobium sp. CB1015]|uniref:amino acid deaminase n=1 Tax=Bradyrhizobium sp. CB1015 TaxID=2976822 RepID=UPI0021AA6608|nr:amino acid deaminase [Bradyrhizobium sp. CB1015]UWU89091.1 amino acid deaminase [Bradyrhizobium sp. CB1015]